MDKYQKSFELYLQTTYQKVIEVGESYVFQPGGGSIKPQDLHFIRKFVRWMKGSKRKIVNCQIFENAPNLCPYSLAEEEEENLCSQVWSK